MDIIRLLNTIYNIKFCCSYQDTKYSTAFSGKNSLEFFVELTCQCLVVRNVQSRLIQCLNHIRHCESLTGTDYAQKRLKLISLFNPIHHSIVKIFFCRNYTISPLKCTVKANICSTFMRLSFSFQISLSSHQLLELPPQLC